MSTTETLTRPEVLHLPALTGSENETVQTDVDTAPVLMSGEEQPPEGAFEAIPDGGRDAWLVVFACSVFLFWASGYPSTWGVLQNALLRSGALHTSTTSVAFIGSLIIGATAALSLLSVQLMSQFGARTICTLAAVICGIGLVAASFAVHSLGGLFVTAGALMGVGTAAPFQVGNSLPVQWFSGRLGLSNGLVKLGGGLGATVLPLLSQKVIDTLGLAWTFRILGFILLATCIPCALLLKERQPGKKASRIRWSLLKNKPFLCLCMAGAVSTFAMFIPAFFIPIFAGSIGLSASTGAWLVAGFGLSSATGRLLAGFSSDWIGPLNTLSIGLVVNAVTMLAIWPVSSSITPLAFFAVINGVANGFFYSTIAVAIASLSGPGLASGAIAMCIAFWTPGYLCGATVAGALIAATGAADSHSIEPYRAAIFYSGGIATVGAMLVLASRFTTEKKLLKKM